MHQAQPGQEVPGWLAERPEYDAYEAAGGGAKGQGEYLNPLHSSICVACRPCTRTLPSTSLQQLPTMSHRGCVLSVKLWLHCPVSSNVSYSW
jgi:hypothetical protein